MAKHALSMSKTRYPGGLRIVACRDCSYAFAAEVDAAGVIDLSTKVPVNQGDLTATHSFFQTPQIQPELSISARVNEFQSQAPFD